MGSLMSRLLPGLTNKQKVDQYLLTLYDNELKFKRPDTEVECITSSVETIVKKIMIAVGKKDSTYEISKQYLVGSMAEGTRIIGPDEFDFLVVLKHFSNRSDIVLKRIGHFDNCWEYKHGKKSLMHYFSETLCQVISAIPLQTLNVISDYGMLSIQSTTMCRHGPAQVIKLLWQPLSSYSKPLDILIDITPCIELQGIDTVRQATDVTIPAHYEALVRDDKYMLVTTCDNFKATYTTTEVRLVRALSTHHKMCYKILKYFLANVIEKKNDRCRALFSSYTIKTSVLRHSAKCKTDPTMSDSLCTCVCDMLYDIKSHSGYDSDGMFYQPQRSTGREVIPIDSIHFHIDNIKQMLVMISRGDDTPSNYVQFIKSCHRESVHPAVQARAERLSRNEIECHLSLGCECHHADEDIKKTHYLVEVML